MSELKPCPFCGDEARVGQVPIFGGHPDAGGFYVQCDNERCHGCMGLRFACGDDPRPELIAAWNRRDDKLARIGAATLAAAERDGVERLVLGLTIGNAQVGKHGVDYEWVDIAQAAAAALVAHAGEK